MKKILSFMIDIYKKYGHLFQGKLFSALIIFYKEKRVRSSVIATLLFVIKKFNKIKVYGGKKEKAIKNVLKHAEFDSDKCKNFIYTWDVYKSIKLSGKILGNCTIDYKKIIDHGLNEYFIEGDDEFSVRNNVVLDCILEYIERLVLYVNNSNIKNKDNIVKYLKKMKDTPADNLEEALQRILMINQLQWQLGHILVGVGRLDYCLDRFVRDDANSNELFNEFFVLLHKYYVTKSNALMGDTGQIVILGGNDENNAYFYNKFTVEIMQVIGKLQLPDPKVLLRVHKTMPNELWDTIIQTMTANVGGVLISNDDIIIDEMVTFGYDRKDACNYITSACWEPIAAESYEQNNILSLNYLEPFNRISSKKKQFDSFNAFLDCYFESLVEYINEILDYLTSIKWELDPLYSMFNDTARIVHKDVSQGGAKYNNYGILTVAMANTVNSFFAIKELVFEQKKYSYEELDSARIKNYKNADRIRNILKGRAKKYGHDDADVIEMVNLITAKTKDALRDYRNPFGGKVKFGLSSPHYIMNSTGYPASFDGREKGDPFSVHISASDNVAYTELMSFASSIEYSDGRFNGNVVDFMMSPHFVRANMGKFTNMIREAFTQGICQMQANIIDSDILLKAKNDPKKFPNLIVRVWGFNAYFNELPEEYKDYLIERAKQSELAFN